MTTADLMVNSRRMRFTKRCNNFPTTMPTDVAQHSYYVSLLVLACANELYEAGVEFDRDEALSKAITHDITESFTGDVPWNVKHGNSLINKALSSLTNEILSGVDTGIQYSAINCKEGIEGAVVDLCDMLELAMYLWEELSAGNTWVETLFTKAYNLTNSKLSTLPVEISRNFQTVKNLISIMTSARGTDIYNID